MRQSLGTAVFGGMLGVTAFGLIFTPAFYTLVQRIGAGRSRASSDLSETLHQDHGGNAAPIAAARPQAGH